MKDKILDVFELAVLLKTKAFSEEEYLFTVL